MKPIRQEIKNTVDAALKSENFKLVNDTERTKAYELTQKILYSVVTDSTTHFLSKLDKICDPIHNRLLNMVLNSDLPVDIKNYAENMKQEKTLLDKLTLKISSIKNKLDEKAHCKLEYLTEEQSYTILERLKTKEASLVASFTIIKKINNAIVIEKLAQNDYSVNLVLVLSELEKKIKSITGLIEVIHEGIIHLKNTHITQTENDHITKNIALEIGKETPFSGQTIKINNIPNINNAISTDFSNNQKEILKKPKL